MPPSKHEPRTDVQVTVDLVILTIREHQLQALLIERALPPFEGRWALPGGFIREAEGLEQAALRELNSRYRLAIVSNVDDDLFAATLPKLGVEFDQIITAQQAEAYKPSPKIFELALSRVGVPAHSVLHVGQSLHHDVLPAQALGLATVWVNRPSPRPGVGAVKAAEGRPDLQVSSLRELAAKSIVD